KRDIGQRDSRSRQAKPAGDALLLARTQAAASRDSRTAESNSLRVNGLGSTFFTPSRRAASADPASPRRKRADRIRMGAAYTARSDSMSGCAASGLGALAITRQ